MNVLLVIAEERAICESLRAALPETDFIILEPSVDRALRRLISVKVDAILIDDAPHLGHQALSRVFESFPQIPSILLSGRSDPESLASWTLAGARACVVKPFSCEALRKAVEGVMQARPPAGAADVAPHVQLSPRGMAQEMLKMSAVGQHQMALRWVSRTSAQIEDPRRLSQSLVDSGTDIFDAVRCAVLLESGGSVRVVAGNGIAPGIKETLRLTYSTGLMYWLEENACLFDRLANGNAVSAVKEMQLLGARLGVPLLVNGRVFGAFVLGEKASGLEYSLEERELLAVMGRCASTAMEKAQAYRDTSMQQSRLDSVLANITAGVVAVYPNKTVAMMNQQAERILQVRAVDVLGRSVQKLGSGFADVVLRTLEDGKARLRQEVHNPAVNATLGMSVTPMGPDGVVVIFSKLPEQAVSKSEVAYSPFWEYLSGRVAQEIKNPMVAINTFAQLLPKKYASEEFREGFFEVVQKEVVRINNVVETLFSFAHQPELVLQRTDLNETVDNVLKAFDDELRARSIEVKKEFDPGAAEADLDPVYFSQAVHNIVQNSIDAMPEGGVLKIETKRRDSKVQVTVADTGPGIRREDAPLVFMPFYSTKERGMGLGLSMAMRIAQEHDGDLKLEGSGEKGTAFTLSIPAEARSSHENDPGH